MDTLELVAPTQPGQPYRHPIALRIKALERRIEAGETDPFLFVQLGVLRAKAFRMMMSHFNNQKED